MKNYLIEELFPTPLYSARIENVEAIQNEIFNAIQPVEFYHMEHWGRPHILTTTTFQEDIIADINLELFNEQLNIHLQQYCDEIEFKFNSDYKRTSWFSMFNQRDFGTAHNHGFADISGCYYFATNGEDGDIYFENPSELTGVSKAFAKKYAPSIRHQPQIGKILLFPSYLTHGIMPNNTENSRVSLSFNITFK